MIEEEGSSMEEGDNQEEREAEGGGAVEEMEEEEEKEEEEEEEHLGKWEEEEDPGCVISDQPLGHGDEPLSPPPPAAPPSSLPGFGVPCCRGQTEVTAGPKAGEEEEKETEPNNNTNKAPPAPLLSEPPPGSASQGQRTESQEDGRTETGKDEVSTDRSQPHNAPGLREEKRHSIKLRERLFQFPLCEKALAFNLPAHNKPKILPLAQYNCCHVL